MIHLGNLIVLSLCRLDSFLAHLTDLVVVLTLMHFKNVHMRGGLQSYCLTSAYIGQILPLRATRHAVNRPTQFLFGLLLLRSSQVLNLLSQTLNLLAHRDELICHLQIGLNPLPEQLLIASPD